MSYSLPTEKNRAIDLLHFPTRHQAFIFRAYEYVPIEKIARILRTTVDTVRKAAEDMGLPDYAPGNIWLRRGYITIIRRMWHILPYEQLLELLEVDEQTLARMMREEDFLDVKLSNKPHCDRVTWRELTHEEALKTREIKKIMDTLDFSGRPPFAFDYTTPQLQFEGEERFSTRMIYAFSGLYQHAFDVDSEEFLPDEQLKAYQAFGINGIWTQGILSRLAPFPFDPNVSEGYEKRLEKMRAMTERLARYGIKLYLYLNEPRSMPLAFFEGYPELRGHQRGGDASLCTSTREVREYLMNAVESICRAVPLIGGFFTITRSENLTNCYSHSGTSLSSKPCTCPRCKDRSVGEVIAQVIGCFLEGARRVSSDIRVFAWSWGWGEDTEDIITRLPQDIVLLSQSELHMPVEFGGIQSRVVDYSMSIVGPGEQAKNEWRLAKERGLEVGAKVQINTTWEASTVPAVPVSPSIEAHMRGLRSEGVKHLLLSWTLGGYPSHNIAAAAKYFYEKSNILDENNAQHEAEKQFAKAFGEFPFHVRALYFGPQNAGPSNLLFETPTGYGATMTCFAYDDIESWRAIYPVDVMESQLSKLCAEWAKGLSMLPDEDCEVAVMAHGAYCLFKSSLNQLRFILARDEERFSDAAIVAENELEISKKMLGLMNKNAAIGYEAANHYYFSKGQIIEKIVNCEYVIDLFKKRAVN